MSQEWSPPLLTHAHLLISNSWYVYYRSVSRVRYNIQISKNPWSTCLYFLFGYYVRFLARICNNSCLRFFIQIYKISRSVIGVRFLVRICRFRSRINNNFSGNGVRFLIRTKVNPVLLFYQTHRENKTQFGNVQQSPLNSY